MGLSPRDVRTHLFPPPQPHRHVQARSASRRPERAKLLLAAIGAGAAFVDVEVEAPAALPGGDRAPRRGQPAAPSSSPSTTTSGRPGGVALASVVSACFGAGADIAKIACMVRCARDNARLLGLLDDERRIVVVGMGEKGRVTRVAALLLGSPFTFASLAPGRETADGQIDHETLQGLLAGLARGGGQGAMTAFYAVAGNPVFHSKSPVMFNAAFRELAVDGHLCPPGRIERTGDSGHGPRHGPRRPQHHHPLQDRHHGPSRRGRGRCANGWGRSIRSCGRTGD